MLAVGAQNILLNLVVLEEQNLACTTLGADNYAICIKNYQN